MASVRSESDASHPSKERCDVSRHGTLSESTEKHLRSSLSRHEEMMNVPGHLEVEDQDFPEDMQDHTGSHFVLHEGSLPRLVWSGVMIGLLAYTATIFLYRFAFCSFHVGPSGIEPIGEDDTPFLIIDQIMDTLFWVDLVLNFFLSYQGEHGVEVDSLYLIAVRNLRFSFWINLLACLPPSAFSDLLALASGDKEPNVDFRIARVYRLQRISRLARLARLTRVLRILRVFYGRSSFWHWFNNYRGVRVINFIIGLFWTLHFLACFWYLVAALSPDVAETWVARRVVDSLGRTLLEEPPFVQWLVSMYFILTVFTTVGFGDMFAVTEAEIAFVLLTMVVGAVVHSIIISEVIGIITSSDQVQLTVKKSTQLIEAYAIHARIKPHTARRMTREITWRAEAWAQSNSFDKSEMTELIVKYMPRWLISELPTKLFNGQLVANAFIGCLPQCPPRLPCLLAVHLLQTEFSAGEPLYQMYEFPFNIFIVVSGTFAFVGRPSVKGGQDAPELAESEAVNSHQIDHNICTFVKKRRASWERVKELSLMRHDTPKSESAKHKSHLYPYKLCGQNSYLGDTEMLLGRLRVATARCECAGTALTLHKQDFAEIQDIFPQFSKAWQSAASRRELARKRALAKLTSGLTVKTLAATRIQEAVRAWRGSPSAPSSPKIPTPAVRGRRPSQVDAHIGHAVHHAAAKDAAGHLPRKDVIKELDSLRAEMRNEMKEVRSELKAISEALLGFKTCTKL